MKKKKIIKILYGISILLLVLFIIFTMIDYTKYNEFYSAPFYVNILLRAVEFIIPSIIFMMISYILNKRNKPKIFVVLIF